MMYIIKGEPVSKGIFGGKITFYNRKKEHIEKRKIDHSEKEIQRFLEASENAIGELQVLYEKSVKSVGQDNALVFGIHQMLIEDPEFVKGVCNIIRDEQVNAEYAIRLVFEQQSEALSKQKRADDMRDVCRRLVKILSGSEENYFEAQEEILLVADDLLPSEMMRMDAKKLAGIVLLEGNANSHAAIFAKAMGISMVIRS